MNFYNKHLHNSIELAGGATSSYYVPFTPSLSIAPGFILLVFTMISDDIGSLWN